MNTEQTIQIVGIGFVILAAILSIALLAYLFISRGDHTASALVQRVAVCLISLVVTSVVVLLGMMPSTQKAVGETVGEWGLISFNLAGPPSVWLIVFFAISRSFSGATDPVVAENDAVSQAFGGYLQALRFQRYEDWLSRLKRFHVVVSSSEHHFIEDLLPKVFFNGPADVRKPKDVVHSTLFFFKGDRAVKLQRIRGKVDAQGGGVRAKLYLPVTGSTPDGKVRSRLFVRDRARIVESIAHGSGEWWDPKREEFDVLVVARYENDSIASGDYVYVDTAKYVEAQGHSTADVSILICADRAIEEFQAWEVAASLFIADRPAPLVFREVMRDAWSTLIAEPPPRMRIESELDDWVRLLDARMTRDPWLQETMASVGLTADAPASTSRLAFPDPVGIAGCRMKRQAGLILSTFAWGPVDTSEPRTKAHRHDEVALHPSP